MKKLTTMLKQARQIQDRLKETRQQLAGRELEATSGGGMVRAVVSGKKQLLRLEIEKEVVDPGDIEMLQDLIISAVNNSLEKADALIREEIDRVTGGLPLPDLM